MTTLAARLNPNGSLVSGSGGDVSALSDLAKAGVFEAMPDARVAVVLRDPLSLARALIALDGQVAALLLLSAQAKPDVITQLILFFVVYGLYEISIWLVVYVEKKRNDQ